MKGSIRWTGLAVVLAAAVTSGGALAGVADPDSGKYTGKTKQSEKVSFKVKGGKVKNPKYGVNLGGCGVTTKVSNSDEISSSGKFKIDGVGTGIKGEFVSDDKAVGKVWFEFNSLNCPLVSGTKKKSVKFTART